MSHPLTAARLVARRFTRSLAVPVVALSVMAASALAYADGVDVSHWQGSINWSRVKSDGVKFAFMKATEGTGYSDPTLRDQLGGRGAERDLPQRLPLRPAFGRLGRAPGALLRQQGRELQGQG